MSGKIKISQNSIVDLVATASPVTQRDFKLGLKLLKNLNLKPHVEALKDIQSLHSFFAQEDKKCFHHFKKCLFNKNSQLIWSLRGGYGSQRLLSFLDGLKTRPVQRKVFIGYSDTTVLHDWIHYNLSWPTLHFSVLSQVHKISKSSQTQFENLLKGRSLYQIFSNLEILNFHKNFKKKKILSRVTGGNLTMIQSLIGTPWYFSRKNQILFLEDVNEQPYQIHRALWQMKQAGVFQGIQALVFGSWNTSVKKEIISQVLKPFSDDCLFPVMINLPCGHQSTNYPLPLGTKTELTLEKKRGHLKISSPF